MKGIITIEQRLKQVNSHLKNENTKLRLENKELKVKVKELELKLEDKELQRKNLMAKFYKPNKAGGSKPLGKKTGERGHQRPKPKDEDITEKITFTPTRCPYCKKRGCLGEAKETIVKYFEDIIIVPEKIVKQYTITKHWCSNCQEYVRSDKVPPNLDRIGPNVMAYILYARYRLRLPFHLIKQSLADLHDFKLSEGEIANQLEKAGELFKSDYDAVKELIKISDKVYCDETGWRIRGNNFWIWVFVTDQEIRYVIEDTRGRGVPEETLGKKEDRVLISDFYAAYKNLPGKNQYCWVHLLRDSKLTESQFHDDLKKVYEELKRELAKDVKKRGYDRLDRLLEKIQHKRYDDRNTERVKQLQTRISKTREQLLECLKHVDIRPENNTAERALRNNVVMRKIFGCSRSVSSAKVMETNTSVIDTLMMREQNKSFMEVILPKLKELRGES